MPIIPPAIVLSTGLSRSRRNLRGESGEEGEAGSSWLPLEQAEHRFTSNSKRGLARTRKVNFACFLVGSKKKPGERQGLGNGGVAALISLGGGNIRNGAFRELVTASEKTRNQQILPQNVTRVV